MSDWLGKLIIIGSWVMFILVVLSIIFFAFEDTPMEAKAKDTLCKNDGYVKHFKSGFIDYCLDKETNKLKVVSISCQGLFKPECYRSY